VERKLVVQGMEWKNLATKKLYCKQGYLNRDKERTVRIRICNDQGFLTIKSKTESLRRMEFEYEISVQDARYMLENLCTPPIIEKIRYIVPVSKNLFWEIDEFLGKQKGLIIAEIELPQETTHFLFPSWLGKEVSGNPQYYNSNIR